MIWSSVKNQLRSVIEWKDAGPQQLFYRWSDRGDEIKNASKLIVGPGQGCLVVYEGKVAAHHQEPGMFEIKSANIPFITTLTKIMQAFESEHKVAIYFYRTTEMLNLAWGTPHPIKYEDPKYKFPVGLRSHGNFSMRIADASSFFMNFVGTRTEFLVDDLRQVFVARLSQPIRDYLATSRFAFTEIDANGEEIADGIRAKVNQTLSTLGFNLTDIRIEGTNFDEDTMARVNRIADATADAAAAKELGLSFTQMQQLAALRDAAKNEGGIAGLGVGMGAGLNIGQMMSQGMMQTPSNSQISPTDRLKVLKDMLDSKLITDEEFQQKKKEILSSL
jgi:membrane protease subunit (stomatin/prohibitin family)